MAPAALFPSENIYILVISFVTLEMNFVERRKTDGLDTRSKFLFCIKKKSGVKIFLVNFFIN